MRQFLALLLCVTATSAYAQAEVFLCIDDNGKKYYANTNVDKGCRKVDLPGITKIPSPPLAAKPVVAHVENAEIGMTKIEVLKKVGKPESTKQVKTREGVTERWTYSRGRSLTFKNDSLEVIEQ
jgi:hypothetical protein